MMSEEMERMKTRQTWKSKFDQLFAFEMMKQHCLGMGELGRCRDAKNGRYGRYICAFLSKAVLIFEPGTEQEQEP